MKHMKKILVLALVVMSVLAIAYSASATTKWVSHSPNAIIHETPDGDLVDRAALGLPVYEYYTTVDGNGIQWSVSNYDGSIGYIKTSYLTSTPSGDTTPQNRQQAFGYYLLRRGRSGYRVENLQLALSAEGFFTGTVNGSFGWDTEEAVEKYQRAEGLDDDGLVGEGTKSHLWEDYGALLMVLGYVQ